MNYDFLTLEDYNTILLSYRDVFYQEFVVDFSNFDLSVDESVVIDDWCRVTRKTDYYSLTVENSLFTGAFSITGATEDTAQRQYNRDGYLRLILNGVSDDTRVRLQLCDLQYADYDFSDEMEDLLQISPIHQFAVYPYKQILSFNVTTATGEPVNGHVVGTDGSYGEITDGECSIIVNAKNKDRILLQFVSFNPSYSTCFVPIPCLTTIAGFTFIDPAYNTLYRSDNAEIGFYHKQINNPVYKLYYGNLLLSNISGDVDSTHIVFNIDARQLTDEDIIPLTLDINGTRGIFNVPIETRTGNWGDLNLVHRHVDVFNLTEDAFAETYYIRGNGTNVLQVYNKLDELMNLPSVTIYNNSKIEFNNFVFRNTVRNGNWDIFGASRVIFNNAVFENINVDDILFTVDSDSLLMFNNCTFKNCTGIFFKGQIMFRYCNFIQTSHNNSVFFDKSSKYSIAKCNFCYEYTVDEEYNTEWSIMDLTNSTVNDEASINSTFFIDNISSIDIMFIDKHLTGTNGFIYQKNGTTHNYNLNVEDIV